VRLWLERDRLARARGAAANMTHNDKR